jgi:hypothetical protein
MADNNAGGGIPAQIGRQAEKERERDYAASTLLRQYVSKSRSR